jgi:hypothetical protein
MPASRTISTAGRMPGSQLRESKMRKTSMPVFADSFTNSRTTLSG